MSTNPPRRSYSHDERARAVAAVAANNGSVHGTARFFGIPETSLRQWCKGERHPELLPLSERYKKDLADKFDRIAELCLGVVLEKMHEMTAYQALIAAAIATDKWLLLSGESTQVTQTRSDPALLQRLQARYAARHPGEAVLTITEADIAAARKLICEDDANRSQEQARRA